MNSHSKHHTLNEIGPDIWTVNGPNIVFAGASMHTRMTIVRLANGNLWVHSPIEYNLDAKNALASLGGSVDALVAPNKFHHMFIQQWHEAHPAASVYAESTVRTKVEFLNNAQELTNEAPGQYRGDIEQIVVEGNRLFQEVAFFHKQSSTLILTDLMINLRVEGIAFLPRLFLKFEGAVFPEGGITRLYRLFTTDKTKARNALSQIRRWSPQQLTFCHGEPFTQPTANVLEEQFRWLDP